MRAAGSRIKGSIGEREIVALFKEAGFPARRVPLSGAMKDAGFGGDVLVRIPVPYEGGVRLWPPGPERKIEVKRRATAFKQITRWLEDNWAVCYREDRGEWKVTMKLSDFLEAVKR